MRRLPKTHKKLPMKKEDEPDFYKMDKECSLSLPSHTRFQYPFDLAELYDQKLPCHLDNNCGGNVPTTLDGNDELLL